MNAVLAMFYSDATRRYLNSSPFCQDARRKWEEAEGKDWDTISNAALLLAEREGYLFFLLGLRLGVMLSGELEELSPPDF